MKKLSKMVELLKESIVNRKSNTTRVSVRPDEQNPHYFNIATCELCGQEIRTMNTLPIPECDCSKKEEQRCIE